MTRPTPGPAEELLLRRARALASAPDDLSRAPTIEVLTFSAAGRQLGVETRRTRRILRQDAACRLPVGDGHLIGVIGFLGEAIPVADLGALLGDRAPQLGGQYVVVLEGEQPPLGLLVDDVFEVADLPLDSLHAAPKGVGAGLARGITPGGVVVLDADRLLGDPRLDHGPASGAGHHLPEDSP